MRRRPEFAGHDAEVRFAVPGVRVADPKACQCGEVLKGVDPPVGVQGSARPAPGDGAAERVVVVNKVDLLPHLEFDLDRFLANLSAVNPGATVIRASARTGEGIDRWCGWIRSRAAVVTRRWRLSNWRIW